MIIGDPAAFAIESKIAHAYERLSFRALGFFVIHVGGYRYGVREPDATMLACSLSAVEKRIAERGRHTAPFATESDSGAIADAFRNALYAESPDESFFGIPLAEFGKLFHQDANDLMWAPDGDAAFDDSSYVLQFDVGDRVRLIAFKLGAKGNLHDPTTRRDVWLAADTFYGTLQQWVDILLTEWTTMLKTPEAG